MTPEQITALATLIVAITGFCAAIGLQLGQGKTLTEAHTTVKQVEKNTNGTLTALIATVGELTAKVQEYESNAGHSATEPPAAAGGAGGGDLPRQADGGSVGAGGVGGAPHG